MSDGVDVGLDVTVDRGIVTFRVTSGGAGQGAARLGEQALAQLRAVASKGVRGVLVDLSASGVAGGAAHAALADAFAPVMATWEARGLPLAVVSARGRAQLEASRVVATYAPRWGRSVNALDDAERWLGIRRDG